MRTPCLCLFTGTPGSGSNPRWHWEQYFGFLQHSTQRPSHSSSAREDSEEQKAKGRKGRLPRIPE